MPVRYVFTAALVVFAFGLITVPPASSQQRRDGALLPQDQSGQVTAVGCLVPGKSVRGGKDEYVLARPRRGPVESVPEGSCTADPGADALQIDNPEKGITKAMVGRWVVISGRLERETDKNPDNLRELDVLSARLVPVVPPRVAVATPAPAPVTEAPRPSRAAEPPPVAAAAPEPTPAPAAPREPARALPKTASNHPASALVGLLLLAGALTLRAFRLRHDG
jgi:LPXTG-motif cell wall-anchored protein